MRSFRVHRCALALAIAAPVLAASPAQAGYEVCNRTDETVDVAMAYLDRGEWVSFGWFGIERGACRELLSGELINRYYYVYAEHVYQGTLWEGDYVFCASDGPFEIFGAGNCRGRGYFELGFFEVEIGKALHWTTDLIE